MRFLLPVPLLAPAAGLADDELQALRAQHVEDPTGQMNRFVLDHPVAGGTYPAPRWRVGETLRDTYTIRLPQGASPSAVNVWTGMWNPKSGDRMKVGNAEGVRQDGSDRVTCPQSLGHP